MIFLIFNNLLNVNCQVIKLLLVWEDRFEKNRE